MTITNERAELLAQYLNADEERAKKLFETEAEEAVALINKDGFDFTVEELAAFAELIEKVSNAKQGELNEEYLNDVNGGIIFTAAGITAAVWACAGVSVACATAQAWLTSRSRKK